MSEQAIPEEIGNQEQTNVIPEVENSGENNGENVVNENAEQDSNAVNNGEKEEKQASEEDENKVEEENNEEKSEEKSEEKTEDKSDEKSEENEVSNDEEKSAEEKPTEDNEEKTEKPVEETVKKITFSIPKECVLTESEELLVAKTFLMKNSVKTNTNTYDHMSQIIMSILDSKIDNAAGMIINNIFIHTFIEQDMNKK